MGVPSQYVVVVVDIKDLQPRSLANASRVDVGYVRQLTMTQGMERALIILLLQRSGKNRIQRIEGLEHLKSLDVLDLHSNDISKIEQLGHMQVRS